MKPLALMIGLLAAATLSCVCDAQILDNPFAEYFERGVTISPDGGNAKDTNAAIHTIDPWPPYVGHTRISQEGRAAVNAVERMYTKCDPFPQVATLGGSTGGTGGSSGGGGGGGGGANVSVNVGGGGTGGGGGGGCDVGGAGAWSRQTGGIGSESGGQAR